MGNAGRTAADLLRLLVSWFLFWAGFWLCFFAMIAVADPGSLDPGEPEAFAWIFSLLGLGSGLLWSAGVRLAPMRDSASRPGILRAALWGAVAAAVPPFLLGKPSQSVVLAPVGLATGTTLAYLARSAGRMQAAGGAWASMLGFVARGFGAEAGRAAQDGSAAGSGEGPQNVP